MQLNVFKRRIKIQTVLPSAQTAAMVFWGAACFRPVQHALAQGRGAERAPILPDLDEEPTYR